MTKKQTTKPNGSRSIEKNIPSMIDKLQLIASKYQSWTISVVVVACLAICLIIAIETQIFIANLFKTNNQEQTQSTTSKVVDGSQGVNIDSENQNSTSTLDKSLTPVVELAPDFPQDVPIYSGVISDTSRSVVAQRKAWTLTVKSDRSLNATVIEIKKSFEAQGWQMDSELSDDQSVTFAYSKNNLTAVIYVMSASMESKINYTVSEQNIGSRNNR